MAKFETIASRHFRKGIGTLIQQVRMLSGGDHEEKSIAKAAIGAVIACAVPVLTPDEMVEAIQAGIEKGVGS